MLKTIQEIIEKNLFFDLQEGKVDCDCHDFYCFKILDSHNFYFGYYHRQPDGSWDANDGAYDLTVTETSAGQLSIVDEFDLSDCTAKEEATERFIDYFQTLYQRDYPAAELSECVVNGEEAMAQLKSFVGDRVGALWASQSGEAVAENRDEKRLALVASLPQSLIEMMGCASAEHFVSCYGKLEDAYFEKLVATLKTLHDRKLVADDYIDRLLSKEA